MTEFLIFPDEIDLKKIDIGNCMCNPQRKVPFPRTFNLPLVSVEKLSASQMQII